MIFTRCRVCRCCVVVSGFLMYVFHQTFVEFINERSRMHLFDAEAGATPSISKKMVFFYGCYILEGSSFCTTLFMIFTLKK
jgi:hypothetical protein